MLCPGISHNTKHHHLTLHKGQEWRGKPFLGLCNHNELNILIDLYTNYYTEPLRNGKLYLPTDYNGFKNDKTQIPYDTEILQSFFELTNTTTYTFQTWGEGNDGFMKDGKKKQLIVAYFQCFTDHASHCPPAVRYIPSYIWTKEGFDIQILKIIDI